MLRRNSPSEVRIVDFAPQYAAAFRLLNTEWLERHFVVEPIDARVLANPQAEILDQGGAILFAVLGTDAVGTVALKHHGNDVLELTKMAVTERHQGLGIGRSLLEAAIRRFEEMDGRLLFLESHSSLAPALHLYESLGFRHRPAPRPSEYRRADVYMVYQGAGDTRSGSGQGKASC